MADAFRYRAFLSYSHADEAVATRLHRALESYVLPRRVRKAHALPRRLIPIFRDVDELAAASGLTTRLQDALDQSQWLIVLCSPAAAQSKYVNQEIEYFLQKHGASRILCALMQGEPPGCFPPALRALNEEPLAADIRPGKEFELSKLKLIAALAGVGFTELRSREAQRRKRQQLIAAALLAGISLGGIAYWDLFHREHVDYYVNYVRRHGIWEGIDRVSAETASHRSDTFRFQRKGRLRPPRRVDYLNGSGYCRPEGMTGPLGHARSGTFGLLRGRYCSVRFEYKENGALGQESWLSNTGDVLDSLTYTEAGLAQFTRKGFASAEGGSGIFYIQAERDEAGLDRRVQFLHSPGNPRANESHEFGWQIDYDEAGRLVRRSVLDNASAEIGTVTHWRYDARGALIETRYADIAGQPLILDGGYAAQLAEHDVWGNIVRERFLLPDGAPALATITRRGEYRASGFSALAYEWDERGNNVLWKQLDADGALVANQIGFAAERLAYDARGNLLRVESLDAALKLTNVAQEGFAVLLRAYGPDNEVIEERALDAAGKPAVRSWGASMTRIAFDPKQRTLKECIFDGNGQPVRVRYGFCFRWTLDARGNPVSIDYLDVGDRPYARPESGVARTVIHRDDRGNNVGASYYGADLKPVISGSTGSAGHEGTVDDYGNKTEVRHFDTHHRLMRAKQGFAVSRAKFDHSGNRTEETYFDELQRPVRSKEGIFGYRAQYDSRARLVRKDFLDARGGILCVPALGACGLQYEYDAFGRVTAEIHLDAASRETARLEHKYNALGWEVETRRLVQGRLAPQPGSGCTITRFEHNGYGETIAEACLDAAGQPVNRRDTGWSVKRTARDINTKISVDSYFDDAGRPIKLAKE